ncbi:MAG: hypothetical protein K0M69_04385, partial [Youngiibacter sp.]|nr:hypothetical protein [Youngiibacter sp.]
PVAIEKVYVDGNTIFVEPGELEYGKTYTLVVPKTAVFDKTGFNEKISSDYSAMFVTDAFPLTFDEYTVEDGKTYSDERIIKFEDGSATLNGVNIASGHLVSEDGDYVLSIIQNDVTRVINFRINKIGPVITIQPYNTAITNQDITIHASTSSGILNSNSYIFSENGTFIFSATDAEGNISKKKVNITNIDKEAPEISGITNNGIYNTEKIITFSEGIATLNGEVFASGEKVSEDGEYTINVIDSAGNISSANFRIDNNLVSENILVNFKKTYSIGESTYAIDETNALWAWGKNTVGQLGDGTYINRYSPIKVLEDVIEVYGQYMGYESWQSDASDTYVIYAKKADGSL